jgi:hypothetical protein
MRIPQIKQVMCTHRSSARERATRAPKMTHRMKSRCRPKTLEARKEHILVVEVRAGMKWTLQYFCAECQSGSRH